MCAMVLLTLSIGLLTFYVRVQSVKKGQLDYKYFRLMSGYDAPEKVIQVGRNFNNQFEVPMLFYVSVLTHIVMGIENTFAIVIAWFFVASRFLHSYIHITSNKLMHRVNAFWLGVLMIFVLWTHILIRSF